MIALYFIKPAWLSRNNGSGRLPDIDNSREAFDIL